MHYSRRQEWDGGDVMPRSRGYRLSVQFIHDVCTYVLAGGFAHVAAEAAGVPADVFANWLRRGEKHRNPLHRQLVREVRRATAKARLAAELACFQNRPMDWLRHGPC